MKMGAEVKF